MGYKLLIVDDEPLTREYFATQLASIHEGWSCVGEACDGQAALDWLDEGHEVDLIVTDIKMPLMDGLELIRELDRRAGRARIMIISGYDEFAMAQEAIKYGVRDYVLKPLSREDLHAALSRITCELEQEQIDKREYQAMISLSAETAKQAAMNFLKAVVTENNAEIKVLHPVMYRLRISLIEAEGAIMAIELDDSDLLLRELTDADVALYRYIVYQTAVELFVKHAKAADESGAEATRPAEASDHAGTSGSVEASSLRQTSRPAEASDHAEDESETIVFFDDRQRLLCLVKSDDEQAVAARAQAFFEQLSDAVRQMTGLRLWGAIGSAQSEVLQLNLSYQQASKTLIGGKLFADEPQLLRSSPMDSSPGREEAPWRHVEHVISLLHKAVSERQSIALHQSIEALLVLDSRDSYTPQRVATIGAYLFERLAQSGEIIHERSIHSVKQHARQSLPEQPIDKTDLAAWLVKSLYPLLVSDEASQSSLEDEHEIVTKAKVYIHAHFAEPISLALLAEHVGVTPGYLSSIFHKQVKESYIKYLTKVRMEQAVQLLNMKPLLKIYDVAERVGYVSVKHFSHVFKLHYGIPPGEYQEKHAGV